MRSSVRNPRSRRRRSLSGTYWAGHKYRPEQQLHPPPPRACAAAAGAELPGRRRLPRRGREARDKDAERLHLHGPLLHFRRMFLFCQMFSEIRLFFGCIDSDVCKYMIVTLSYLIHNMVSR